VDVSVFSSGLSIILLIFVFGGLLLILVSGALLYIATETKNNPEKIEEIIEKEMQDD